MLYTEDMAKSDYGAVEGAALCEEIKCWKNYDMFKAYTGMAFDHERGLWYVLSGGGHSSWGGNDVAHYDFSTLTWVRDTIPQPYNGEVIDTNDTGECLAPALGPPASHHWDGVQYIPGSDNILWLGGAMYCSNGGYWPYRMGWVYDQVSKEWSRHDNLNEVAWTAFTAYDPLSGMVIGSAGAGPFFIINPETWEIEALFKYLTDHPGAGTAVFDPELRAFYMISSKGLYRLFLDDRGYPANVDPSAYLNPGLHVRFPTKSNVVANAGMALRKSTGELFLWLGDARVWVYNSVSNQMVALAPSCPAPAMNPKENDFSTSGVYSKWVYIESLDVFAGISSYRGEIVLYKPPTVVEGTDVLTPEGFAMQGYNCDVDIYGYPKNVPGEPVPDPAPTPDPDPQEAQYLSISPPEQPYEIETTGTWEERCQGAILCDPLDNGNVISRGQVVGTGLSPLNVGLDRDYRKMSHKTGQPGETCPMDGYTEELPGLNSDGEGSGSLKMTLTAGCGDAGSYFINFTPDGSWLVSPTPAEVAGRTHAKTVYIQWRAKFDCDFLWTDCDPSSPDYQTTHRAYERDDGGPTAMKQVILSEGQRPELNYGTPACGFIQAYVNHGPDHYYEVSTKCNSNWQVEARPLTDGFFNIELQPGAQNHCLWKIPPQWEKRVWGLIDPDCVQIVADEWLTFQLRIEINGWETSEEFKAGQRSSRISLWVAREGEPQRLVIDWPHSFIQPWGIKSDGSISGDPEHGLGKFWLPFHIFHRSTLVNHPQASVLFDSIIVSPNLIPNPS